MEEVFPSAGYQYVPCGLGLKPERKGFSRRADEPDRADPYFREAAQLTRRTPGALSFNRNLLEHIRKNGLPRP